MSNYYTAHVSNEGLDAIRSDFKVLIKADSLHKARAGAAARILTVERATDQEIFEAGRNGNVVLNLSDAPTDENQHELPLPEGYVPPLPAATHAVDMTQPSAHDGTVSAGVAERFGQLIGETKSGSAPGWLRDAVSQTTGD